MAEILTNLDCLWGGRGPVLQPHPLRNSAGTSISAILTTISAILTGREVEVLLLLDTSSSPQLRHLSWFKYRCVGFGDRPPSHWWWRNCRISDKYFKRSGNTMKSWRIFLEVRQYHTNIWRIPEVAYFGANFAPHGSFRIPSTSKFRTLLLSKKSTYKFSNCLYI